MVTFPPGSCSTDDVKMPLSLSRGKFTGDDVLVIRGNPSQPILLAAENESIGSVELQPFFELRKNSARVRMSFSFNWFFVSVPKLGCASEQFPRLQEIEDVPYVHQSSFHRGTSAGDPEARCQALESMRDLGVRGLVLLSLVGYDH